MFEEAKAKAIKEAEDPYVNLSAVVKEGNQFKVITGIKCWFLKIIDHTIK